MVILVGCGALSESGPMPAYPDAQTLPLS